MKKIIGITILSLLLVFTVSTTLIAAETEVTMTVTSPSTPKDSNVKAFMHFKDLVENRSDGRIEVDIQHSGALGGHRDNIEQLQMGSIQMAEINTAVLSNFDDNFMVFDLPYVTKSMEELRYLLLDQGVGEMMSDSLEEQAKLSIIGWHVRAPRVIYNSSHPIETVEDLEGLSIRLMESPVMMDTFEALGAEPNPIAADERYMALQTGTVDAAENSAPLIITESEYEVTEYVSLTNHFITPNAYVVDTNFLNNLPEDLLEIVLQSGRDASFFGMGVEKEQLDSALDELEDLGMEVNEIDDLEPFRAKVEHLHEEYGDNIDEEIRSAVLGF